MELSDWFKGFEKGIARLSSEQREAFFSECGKNCVQSGTLQVYKTLYEDAHGDLDIFLFESQRICPGSKECEIAEKGTVYHLYFTECTCSLHKQGYVSTPILCECSRQSILYVLHSLWKGKRFQVTLCNSILRGSDDCKIRIKAEDEQA